MYASFTRKDDPTRKPIAKKIIFKRIQFVRMINFNDPSKALKKNQKEIPRCNSTFIITYYEKFWIQQLFL